MHLLLRRLELCLGVDNAERCLQRLAVWCAFGLFEKSSGKPPPERLRADRPGFAMPAETDIELCRSLLALLIVCDRVERGQTSDLSLHRQYSRRAIRDQFPQRVEALFSKDRVGVCAGWGMRDTHSRFLQQQVVEPLDQTIIGRSPRVIAVSDYNGALTLPDFNVLECPYTRQSYQANRPSEHISGQQIFEALEDHRVNLHVDNVGGGDFEHRIWRLLEHEAASLRPHQALAAKGVEVGDLHTDDAIVRSQKPYKRPLAYTCILQISHTVRIRI